MSAVGQVGRAHTHGGLKRRPGPPEPRFLLHVGTSGVIGGQTKEVRKPLVCFLFPVCDVSRGAA